MAQTGFSIRYRFANMNPCACSATGDCQNYATLRPKEGPIAWDTYCYQGNNRSESEFSEVQSNKLYVQLFMNSSVSIDLDLYSVHYGLCVADELCCPACINKQLTCNNAQVSCESGRVGSCPGTGSTVTLFQGFKINVVTLVVTIISLVSVITILVCLCIRRDRKGRPNRDASTMPSAEAQNQRQTTFPNRAWTEADGFPDSAPPPDYNSLEAGSTQKVVKADDDELPPSYGDAIRHLDKYKIYDLIEHI